MGILSFGKQHKSLSETEEETEELQAEDDKADVELSLAQKKAAIAELKQRGLKPSHFPNWAAIMKWLKTH